MIISNETQFEFDFDYWNKIANIFFVDPELEVRLFKVDKDNPEYKGVEGWHQSGLIEIPFEKRRRSKEYLRLKELTFFHELRHEIQEDRYYLSEFISSGNKKIIEAVKGRYKGSAEQRKEKALSNFAVLLPAEVDAETFAHLMMELKPFLSLISEEAVIEFIRNKFYGPA